MYKVITSSTASNFFIAYLSSNSKHIEYVVIAFEHILRNQYITSPKQVN